MTRKGKIREQVASVVDGHREYLENVLKADRPEPQTQWGWAVIVVDRGEFVLGYEHLEESEARSIAEEFNDSTADFTAIAWPEFVPFPGKLEAC